MATAIAPPITDTVEAFPELVETRRLARAGDYEGLRSLLMALRERSPSAEAAAAYVASEVADLEARLERVLIADPADTFARGLLGARLVAKAWEARSNLRAQHVSTEQWEVFRRHLQTAEQHLIRACAEAPAWALPWHQRLNTARGLQLGVIEARRRFDRLVEHNPEHLGAHGTLLQMLLPKWYGSWDEAWAFARATAGAAPAGSAAHTLPATVHLETYIDVDAKAGRAWLQRPEVIQELATSAAQSVLHPDYDGGFGWIDHHSTYAALHVLAGREAEAAPHFQALGPWFSDWVWGYLPNHTARITKARAAALAKGASR